MSSKSNSRLARRMDRSEVERQELAGAIRHALPRDGRVEMHDEESQVSTRTRTPRSGIFASHGNLWNPVSSTVFQQSKTNETKTRFATPRQKE
jgi:hypothetical protein